MANFKHYYGEKYCAKKFALNLFIFLTSVRSNKFWNILYPENETLKV